MFIRAYLRASTREQDATRAREELKAFAKERGWTIAATYVENESGATLRRPELLRLLSDCQPGDVLLHHADLVLTLGYDPVEFVPAEWNLGKERRIVHVDTVAADIDNDYRPDVELLGDLATTLTDLTRALHTRGGIPQRDAATAVIVAWMTISVMPASFRTLRDLITLIRADFVANVVKEGQFVSLDSGVTFHYREKAGDALVGIFMQDRRDPTQPSIYLAERGRTVEAEGQSFLMLEKGTIQREAKNTNTTSIISF